MNHATFTPQPRKRLPVITGVMAEHFICEPYRSKIRRSVCATRYADANRPGKRKPGAEAMRLSALVHAQCAGCSVGKAHADGVAGAPSVASPVLPVGHVPPVPEKRSTRFVVEAGRQHAQKQERRMAPSRRHARPNVGKCEGCGGPKPAGEGRRRCEPCKAKTAEAQRERDRVSARARYHPTPRAERTPSRWTSARNERPELVRLPCRCGAPKPAGRGHVYCDACQAKATEERMEKDRQRNRHRRRKAA